MRVDYCKGCRKFYGGVLTYLATNNFIACIMSGLPLYYLAVMMIVYHSTYVATLFSGGSYSFISALIIAMINSGVCLWRIWPNGLTISIFILKALGYWSFVSFFILLFYGIVHLPIEVSKYLFAMIMPEIVLLLFSADVLRAARTKHFKFLESQTSNDPISVVVKN